MTTETVKTPAPKTPKAKNVAPKTAAKKAAPKVEETKKPGAAKKVGLRGPQWRILTVLSKSKVPMSRQQMSDKANVDLATFTSYIGSDNPEKRAILDKRKFPSLLTLGLVKFSNDEDSRAFMYEITAKGRKEAEKAPKE